MRVTAAPQKRFWDFLEAGILGEMGLPMLVVSLVLFVSAMTLLGANVSELRQGYARVQRSNEALLQLETVNNDILRIEMTVRGFALSGDPDYISWKQMASAAVNDRVASFDTVFAGDPVQLANVKKLRALLAVHGQFFDDLTSRARIDRRSVIQDILAYSKRIGRRDIEDQLVVMRSREMKELASHQAQAENRVVNAYGYALGMSALALIMAGVGFGLLVHDRRVARRMGH